MILFLIFVSSQNCIFFKMLPGANGKDIYISKEWARVLNSWSNLYKWDNWALTASEISVTFISPTWSHLVALKIRWVCWSLSFGRHSKAWILPQNSIRSFRSQSFTSAQNCPAKTEKSVTRTNLSLSAIGLPWNQDGWFNTGNGKGVSWLSSMLKISRKFPLL